jgi:hypothetical protein
MEAAGACAPVVSQLLNCGRPAGPQLHYCCKNKFVQDTECHVQATNCWQAHLQCSHRHHCQAYTVGSQVLPAPVVSAGQGPNCGIGHGQPEVHGLPAAGTIAGHVRPAAPQLCPRDQRYAPVFRNQHQPCHTGVCDVNTSKHTGARHVFAGRMWSLLRQHASSGTCCKRLGATNHRQHSLGAGVGEAVGEGVRERLGGLACRRA